MAVKLGYLLPTRERAMNGVHETGEILALADHAESVGLDSVWIGDSVTAKPRHDPLTLLAAIAGRTHTVTLGTAVLLSMLRNPVLLAQQLATLDQISEGRLILGVGIANDSPPTQAEFKAVGVPFEKRVGTLLEGLRLAQALWTADAPLDWEGRWSLKQATLAPKPYTPGGPEIWGGGAAPGALQRCGKNFAGWFPAGPGGADKWQQNWNQVRAAAEEAGRDPNELTGAAYLTVSIDDDAAAADQRLNSYLQNYYKIPAEKVRAVQYGFAGSKSAVKDWLHSFIAAGATHLCVRTADSRDREHMDTLAEFREDFR